MNSSNKFGILGVLVIALVTSSSAQSKNLTPEQVERLARADDIPHFNVVLDQLIQPRIVGTPSHEVVKNYIINELRGSNLHVELDSFVEQVPIMGNVTFTNIVARLNPNANTYLALACHYDSKLIPGQVFYAATDSAVPCSMMLNLVKTLGATLQKARNRTDISLMLMFFDGEEAFLEWTEKDSVYGSRHLASKWSTPRSADPDSRLVDDIQVLVLLDLLGAANPKFYNFFYNTATLHNRLLQIEGHLRKKELITRRNRMFQSEDNFVGFIDDDHRPFLQKNVPILHVIPHPFPKVWHKTSDNLENLSAPTIKDLLKIFRVFVADYFETHQDTRTFRF